MACLDIAGTRFDIDLAVFDKDGTLVDFDRLWAGKLARAVGGLSKALGLSGQVRDALYLTLGVDPATQAVIAESPLAVASVPKLGVVASTVLHQHGMPWHMAETASRDHFMPVVESLPTRDDLLPIGNVAALFQALHSAGVRIAILTSDDRAATLASLPLLGVERFVAEVVCGDDPVPNKPSPEGLLKLSRHFDVAVSRMLMVGDSVTDMRTGRNAGVACCLGVLSGTGGRDDLAQHAHVVADDLHVIKTVAG